MGKNTKKPDELEKLISLCKRKGYIFQSSEIYDGINGFWDYGPLGVLMRNKIKVQWWRSMVQLREDVEGLDSSIITHPRVWEASGHVESFSDPMVDCKECKGRFREDNLLEGNCPKCGSKDLTEPRAFHLMLKTSVGPVESDKNIVYLRPETCQAIYLNFHNVANSARQKVPFGIAQIGKVFRNEINPRHFIFRSREFEQMELQFFVKPGTDGEWFEKWKEERLEWHKRIGLNEEKLKFVPHPPDKLAHYCTAAEDIEFQFPFDWQELEGIHNRTNYDLSRHSEYSNKDLKYFDEESKEHYIPYVIETSVGVDRCMLALLSNAYEEEEERVVLRLSPHVAPYTAAVFPLVKKEGMPEIAHEIVAELRKQYNVFYDQKGAVGRRYRRQDEAGTPFCITVDTDTLSDRTVTIRERDSMKQIRVKIDDLHQTIGRAIENVEEVFGS